MVQRGERAPGEGISTPDEMLTPTIERNTLRTLHSGEGHILMVPGVGRSAEVLKVNGAGEALTATPADIFDAMQRARRDRGDANA